MSNDPRATFPAASTHADYDPFAAAPTYGVATTPGQLEMWFSDQSGAGASCAYNESFSIRLKGAIDAPAMTHALCLLAEFHEALRGHFSRDGERFVIEPQVPVSVAHHDLSQFPATEREARVAELIGKDSQTPFDLEHGPLYRATLIRLEEEECVLLLSAHHAACDGWSLDVILADLGRLYSAVVGSAPFPDPPQHAFSDFVKRCNTLEHRLRVDSARSFWRKQFATLPPILELPYDGFRPKTRSFAAHQYSTIGSVELLAAVKAYACSHGVSFFSVLLTALATLVYRISGHSDLVIGIPIAGHAEAEMEDCVGHLVNLVPIRFRIEPGISFLDLCLRTNTAVLDARENSTVGFGEVVAELGIPRDPARIPLINTVFTHVQKFRPGKLKFGDCSVDYQLSPRSFETFEFNLTVIEAQDSLRFRAHANADLYSRDWLERRLREFKQLLQAGCAAPDQPVVSLAILSAEDVQHLLVELNQGTASWDCSALIHRQFEQVVDRNPNGTAVLFEDQSITWSALDKAANQLAVELIKRGVVTDDRVGVCLHRGLDLAISFLAVLKAGAGYVPLDPAFPAERISNVLADAAARILISTADVVNTLEHHPDVLLLDSERAIVQANSDARLSHDESSSQLAYVIYTSGSTGKPKGVMVEHRNVVSLLAAMEQAIGLDATGVWLSGATVAFDMSVVEILGCLTHGRTLALLGETVLGQVKDPRYTIPELIKRYGVTIYQCTPSQCQALMLDEVGRNALGTLRQLIVAGEPLAPELAAKILQVVNGELINGYGPTETTVYATIARVRAGQPVHIGRPIANTVALVLDEHRQLVPFGVTGELYIGGPGVTRGYLGQPALTAARFGVIDGFAALSQRFYRSGDLVRYLPNGDIFYLGRNDTQVKLRGYRIELGEIESVLLSIEGVSQCAVEAKGDAEQKRLVAYLVVTPGFGGDASCRDALRAKLPDYMVPSVYTHLDEMPLTPTGKLDRSALPEPTEAVPSTVDFELPKDALEARLLEIWLKTLGLKRVSVTADFFALGGHSLLAVRFFNDVYTQFRVKLPLSTLFECPTVRHLAERLRELLDPTHVAVAPQWTAVVPMRTRGDLPPVFCVAGLGGNTLNLRFLMEAIGERQPFYGLQHRGVDGVLPAHRTIEDMAREFYEEIRVVQPKGPYYLAGYSAGGLAAYELAQILIAEGQSVGVVILLDTCNPAVSRWTLKNRLRAHWDGLSAVGAKYLWVRTLATTQRRISEVQRSLRAHLAPLKNYEYRLDAVVCATLEAERNYVPRPLQANVFLLKTDYSMPVLEGIGYPPHESNGWGDVACGGFEIVRIRCSHRDLVSERLAPTTGAILRNSLREVRAKLADDGPSTLFAGLDDQTED